MNAHFLNKPARGDRAYFRVSPVGEYLAAWLERNEVSRKDAESLTLEAGRYVVDLALCDRMVIVLSSDHIKKRIL